MKRFILIASMALAFAAATLATTPSAQAGLFGGKAASTPTPSPSPSALPAATPEPADIAIPRLQAKLKANPNDQQAMSELAGQFLGINRPDLTVQLTQHLLKMGDKTAQVYYLDGYAFEQLGRIDAAIADLQLAEDLDPSNSSVLANLADLYLRTNHSADAERIAKRAVVLNKDDPQSYETLGAVYASEQKFDDARAQFEKAVTLSPKDTRPIFQIAQTYGAQNNIPLALQSIGRALAIDPGNVQALVFKATLYAKQHDDSKALPAFDDAVVAAPDANQKVTILTQKASYLVSEKKNNEAESVLMQMIAQYPKNAAAHVSYGDFLASQKNTSKAEAEWRTALGIDKDQPEALLHLAQMALAGNRVTDAVAYLKHLTQVAPDAQNYAMLGQAYSYTHNYSGSKDACSKSFQIDRQPTTLGCVAGADFELKNYKEAAAIFDALDNGAHGFLDQNPQLLFIAGKSYGETRQPQKALTAYRRLLAEMRKGTKQYAEVEHAIAELQKKKH